VTTGKTTGTQMLLSISVLVLICNFVLLVALFGVPAISEASGIAREHVTWSLAGACFVVAIVATRWLKALNKKRAVE